MRGTVSHCDQNTIYFSDELNQHDVIYLTDISHDASLAGEITDLDSYIIDEYPDQEEG